MSVSSELPSDSVRVMSVVGSSSGSDTAPSSYPLLVVRWRGPDDSGDTSGLATLSFVGELDAYSAAVARQTCDQFLDDHDVVRVDLHDVTFIDSAGTRFLEECCDRVNRRGGDCRLFDPSPAVRRMLAILDSPHRGPVEGRRSLDPALSCRVQ